MAKELIYACPKKDESTGLYRIIAYEDGELQLFLSKTQNPEGSPMGRYNPNSQKDILLLAEAFRAQHDGKPFLADEERLALYIYLQNFAEETVSG